MRVCVFCASSGDVQPAHHDMARALGTWIGAHGHTLVWGGCKLGLMQVVGAAAQEAGGRVVAVLPRFLAERDIAFDAADELLVTESMAARKHSMREQTDVFVALPGGVGTWDEIIEVLALKKLARIEAHVVLANVGGYFDPLLEMFERSVEQRFNPPDFDELFHVVEDSEDMQRVLSSAASVAPSR